MFAVLGATGNTGRIVAETLLATGNAVRAVVTNPARGHALKDKGAELAVADIDDLIALERVFSDVQGAYVLLPPVPRSSHRLDNGRRAKNLAAAIQAADVGHVVMLSSIGAQHADGTGPILSLHDAEAILARQAQRVTFLRAAYFMENWALALPAVAQGVLPTFLLSDSAIPMVATRDIGHAAVRLLVEGAGVNRIIQLAGPKEYSPIEVAAGLSRMLRKPVVPKQLQEDDMISTLVASGFGAESARLFQEIIHGFNSGRVAWEQGPPIWRGETEIGSVLQPLLAVE